MENCRLSPLSPRETRLWASRVVIDQQPEHVPAVAGDSKAKEEGHVSIQEPHPKKKSRKQDKLRFYVRECNVRDKIVWRIMGRDNSNVFMQLSESLGATKIFTEELLKLALKGTSKNLLQNMYKQHCARVNLLSRDAGTEVTTTERDFS